MLDVRCLPAFGGARGDQGSMFIFFSKPFTVLPAQKNNLVLIGRSP